MRKNREAEIRMLCFDPLCQKYPSRRTDSNSACL